VQVARLRPATAWASVCARVRGPPGARAERTAGGRDGGAGDTADRSGTAAGSALM